MDDTGSPLGFTVDSRQAYPEARGCIAFALLSFAPVHYLSGTALLVPEPPAWIVLQLDGRSHIRLSARAQDGKSPLFILKQTRNR